MNRALFLLPLALVACDDGFGWDDLLNDSDTAYDTGSFYSGPVEIAQLDYRCNNGSPDSWWYQATMNGWAGDVWLDIYETGDGNWPNNPNAVWEESHPLTSVAYDEGGAWDVWEATLSDVESPGSVVSGRSTLWDCWWDDGNSLAFMITLYDDTAREVECAIWGNESGSYFNDYRGNDCICFDPDGNCNN